jgi:uncharacterized membrane protein (UPF0127 family)
MDPAGAQPARIAALPRGDLAPGLRVYEACTPRARALGLAFLERIPCGSALHIRPCRTVHTFGMRFEIDLLWLGPGGEVVAVDRDVPRRRMRACVSARSVLETGAGDADRFLAALGRPLGMHRTRAPGPDPGAWT